MEEKTEPAIPQIVRDWKNRERKKKENEIELLKLEIEKVKLMKQLKEIRK